MPFPWSPACTEDNKQKASCSLEGKVWQKSSSTQKSCEGWNKAPLRSFSHTKKQQEEEKTQTQLVQRGQLCGMGQNLFPAQMFSLLDKPNKEGGQGGVGKLHLNLLMA